MPEEVELELFTNRFSSIAGEMGEMLRRTALSTNVRDRLDFSCALLDAEGRLVVNAPHIPVHLGALGICVRAVRDALPLGPGDAAVTNHPGFGGSHLPDVTVIHPVFDDHEVLLGYTASRAHHSEIGGKRPGSMPPDARNLAEEGVVISPRYLVREGEACWQEIRELLATGPFPSRSIDENLADLNAALAANHRGAESLRRLATEHGTEKVRFFIDALRRRAGQRLRDALERLPAARLSAREELDDGTPLVVRMETGGGRLRVDWTGTGDTHPGNLNATPAIVNSAMIYALRLLLAEPLPLNEGLLEPVELVLPPGSLLDPHFPDDPFAAPAVVGGNVETSQRLVDTLLKAFGLCACSQGTMNNLIFGNDSFGYYETVCGGAGAGPDWHGESGVHTHMTNTRITDPEILELRYPVRLERFALRPGSGGAGEHRGGDGVIRELTFLEPLSLSLLSQHRRARPYGAKGGEPGAAGQQELFRADGSSRTLAGVDHAEVGKGDRLVLETPGGGGWGPPATKQEMNR